MVDPENDTVCASLCHGSINASIPGEKKHLPSLQSLMAISNQSQILFGGTS